MKKAVMFIGDRSFPDDDNDAMIVYSDGTALFFVLFGDEYSLYWISLDRVQEPSKEWFKLNDVARSVGVSPVDLAAALNDPDVRVRANAYRDVIGHYGPHEFDSYPHSMTRRDVAKKYGRTVNALFRRDR